ncbi:MAG: TRAP transporter small permease subunit [Candidatus Eisenbacteria bacterium]|nr:TRAP transporter small permease subunit [Candidatus Eisenbacteria bacterium]
MVTATKPQGNTDPWTPLRTSVRYIDLASKWSGYLFAPIALAYMVIIVYEVVMRYLFNRPTNWAHELSTFLFGTQFMLGGAFCLWRGSMVNVDILHAHIPVRLRAAIDAVFMILPIAICLLMFWLGGQMFLSSLAKLERTNTVWGPPLYPLRGVIPLAAALMLSQVIAQLFRRVYIVFTGRTLETAVTADRDIDALPREVAE